MPPPEDQVHDVPEDQQNINQDKIVSGITKIEKFLDAKIGFYWWKKYIAGAFWSNVATPVNLFITLVTALTTGQAVHTLLPMRQTATGHVKQLMQRWEITTSL